MRISDMELREVAARMRTCAQNVSGTRDFAMYLSYWVGIDEVTDDEGKHFSVAADRRCAERTLEKLADLIDRPTCHMEGTSRSGFRCSACGEQIPPMRIFCRDSAGDHWVPMEHNRCPMCGAEVVSND